MTKNDDEDDDRSEVCRPGRLVEDSAAVVSRVDGMKRDGLDAERAMGVVELYSLSSSKASALDWEAWWTLSPS